MSATTAEPLIIDVRPIPKPQRHPLIFDAMEKLDVGEALIIFNDHNPIPLRSQVETLFGEQFEWHYLEEGPEVFRLCFTRRNSAPAGWQCPSLVKKSELPMQQLQAESVAPSPIRVNLLETASVMTHSGPQWAHESEDLDATLLAWEAGKQIEAHINTEVDVVWIGVAGEGRATINGKAFELRPGVALLIPKGCERAVESTTRFSYLSVHRRRRGLMPTLGGKPLL